LKVVFKKRNRKDYLRFAGLITEVLLIVLSYFFSYLIRFRLMNGVENVPYMRYGAVIIPCYALFAVSSYSILKIMTFDEYNALGNKLENVVIVHLLGGFILISALYVLHMDDFSRVFIVLFTLINIIISDGEILLIAYITGIGREKEKNKKHVVVFGNGELCREYIDYVNSNPKLGIVVDGYVSRVTKDGLGRNLGDYEDIADVLDRLEPTELVIALESHETEFMPFALEAADTEGIGVQLIPFYNKYLPAHPKLEKAGDLNMINLRSTPLDSIAAQIIKRLVDIIGSILLIILTLPLMIITAIGVKISSEGPVLFKQNRIGKDKKTFEMYKFRSMRVTDTEESGWSTNTDSRRTKFGSFIRKYSIDEIPQFFNVLKGDMSLVGPRPEIPYHVRHFKTDVPRYLVRQQVKPGITGWAQVHGLRGDTSIEERVEYDIWYIENWSLWLDIRILVMTLFKGIKNDEEIVH
jgi:Undecaprenyl-phosphate glucose phosphotransferase